jgi:threonine dehydrogenase-like Zn-dependent dehydrogenase
MEALGHAAHQQPANDPRREHESDEVKGTQAEFVRIPFADTSLYRIPDGVDEEAMAMLSDILPTGFECGVVNGKVVPGSKVAIVGAGPIGLAALLTAQFYSPAEIIMIDLDDYRLEVAKRLGATAIVNSTDGKAVEAIMRITGQTGLTLPSKRWASRPPSSCARILSPGAARSPISECMGRRCRSTWNTCGIVTLPSPRVWSTRSALQWSLTFWFLASLTLRF